MADLVLVLEEHVQEELDKVKGMSISELKDPIKQPGVKGVFNIKEDIPGSRKVCSWTKPLDFWIPFCYE